MTLFEYMGVAISLIVALTFAEVLRGLRNAMDSKRRYGIHFAWLLIKLSNPISFWWIIWGLQGVPDFWNFGTYLLALIIPSIIFLQVISLLGDSPARVDDWRSHYYEQRKWFFGLNATLGVAVTLWIYAVNSTNEIQIPVFPTVAYLLITALSIAAFVTENPRFHAAFVCFVAVFTAVYYGVVNFSPGAF